jgi:hypothetical protein
MAIDGLVLDHREAARDHQVHAGLLRVRRDDGAVHEAGHRACDVEGAPCSPVRGQLGG